MMPLQQQWSYPAKLPRLEAQMLLLHALGRDVHDRAWLLAHGNQALTSEQQASFARLVERRLAGEPVAYLTGYKEFFGLRLRVNAHVLDPRPDTEILVEWALERLQALADSRPRCTLRVLDLGTGSGAVGLAIKHAHPGAHVVLLDASAQALAVACHNAAALGLIVQGVQGHWLKNLEHVTQGVPFDLIVSNPPYIAQDDAHLAALQHEPMMALTSGVDGLDAMREIIADAPQHLVPGGWLLLEHGYNQWDAVRDLLHAHGFGQIGNRLDYQGITRCSGGAR